MFSGIVPIVMICVIEIFKVSNKRTGNCDSCLNKYYDLANNKTADTVVGTNTTIVGNYILSFMMSVYILIAIYSCIYAIRRLERPGVSKEVRKMFLKKHVAYVVVFIVIWVI